MWQSCGIMSFEEKTGLPQRILNMNEYLKNLEKIEFVVTYACTGRCKHCSEGDHLSCGEHIDPKVAASVVEKTASLYGIKTVMAFGGEPLLYPESVYEIMSAAKKNGVEKRQVITNGFFSKDTGIISDVVFNLAECGVNDLLLSADAFHQETIPLDIVKVFAFEAKNMGLPIRIQPAWLVNISHENPYNQKTNIILQEFKNMGIEANEGNVIFPEGNALIYLKDFFKGEAAVNPYIQDPKDIRCLSFEPDGSILGENIYTKDIIEIIEGYRI